MSQETPVGTKEYPISFKSFFLYQLFNRICVVVVFLLTATFTQVSPFYLTRLEPPFIDPDLIFI